MRRFRFSLRTLLIFSLLCGAVMLLWRNREPWGVYKIIQEPTEISEAGFSPSDKYFYTVCEIETDTGAGRQTQERIKVYNHETGEVVFDKLCECYYGCCSGEISFSPGEMYILRKYDTPTISSTMSLGIQREHHHFQEMWQMGTGAPIFAGDLNAAELYIEEISSGDHFTILGPSRLREFVKLPSAHAIYKPNNDYFEHISPDEKWFAWNTGASVEIRSTSTGEVAEYLSENLKNRYGNTYGVVFSPDNTSFIVEKNEGVILLSILDGKVIDYFPGENHYYSGNTFSCQGRFMLTENGGAITVIRDLSEKGSLRALTGLNWSFAANSERFLFETSYPEPQKTTVFDPRTGKVLWSRFPSAAKVSPEGSYLIDHDSGELLDAETGTVVQNFRELKEQYPIASVDVNQPVMEMRFANRHTEFAAIFQGYYMEKPENEPLLRQVHLWHQRRPWQWYGYAWLWECWLVVALLAALGWSIRKER